MDAPIIPAPTTTIRFAAIFHLVTHPRVLQSFYQVVTWSAGRPESYKQENCSHAIHVDLPHGRYPRRQHDFRPYFARDPVLGSARNVPVRHHCPGGGTILHNSHDAASKQAQLNLMNAKIEFGPNG